MDGRTIRRWCVVGVLLTAALGCKSNKQQNLIGPMPDTGSQLVNMPVAKSPSRSLWGSSTPTATMPVEVTDTKKGPASAESLVAIANVQLEAALDEKTAAGSKEGLLDT